jgi:hypothetical protein
VEDIIRLGYFSFFAGALPLSLALVAPSLPAKLLTQLPSNSQ